MGSTDFKKQRIWTVRRHVLYDFLTAFQWLVHLTDVSHLWILATSKARCVCTSTNTGHLPVSHRLSVNVTIIKSLASVYSRMKSRFVGLLQLIYTRWKGKWLECVGSRYHSVRRVAKYMSCGKAITMTKPIFGKCIWVQIFVIYTNRGAVRHLLTWLFLQCKMIIASVKYISHGKSIFIDVASFTILSLCSQSYGRFGVSSKGSSSRNAI